MQKSPITRCAIAALCFGMLAATACQDNVTAPAAPSLDAARSDGNPSHPFTVYTQNMYLGGDSGPLFTLDFTDLGAILAATGPFWAAVQASDFPGRAAKFVDHIQETRPDVVTFQEAIRFVLLDGSFAPVGGADLLAAVQAEITRRGLPYEVAVLQEETSSTLPLTFDPSTGTISRWLNFTDRTVILKRSDVKVIASAHGLYATHLSLGPVELVRGWAMITIDRDGTPYHFFATHLETPPATPIQDAQALELNVLLAGLDGVTILAGDLNSDAVAAPGTPTWTATYGNLVADGFTDAWLASPHRRGASSVTCCQAANLLGPSQLDQRIDFVLVRSALASGDDHELPIGIFKSELVGDQPSDRTGGGLWPSDHAGLVATIAIPASRREHGKRLEMVAAH